MGKQHSGYYSANDQVHVCADCGSLFGRHECPECGGTRSIWRRAGGPRKGGAHRQGRSRMTPLTVMPSAKSPGKWRLTAPLE